MTNHTAICGTEHIILVRMSEHALTAHTCHPTGGNTNNPGKKYSPKEGLRSLVAWPQPTCSEEHERSPVVLSTPDWISLSSELPQVKGGAICVSLNCVAFCVVIVERLGQVAAHLQVAGQKKAQLYSVPGHSLPPAKNQSSPGAGGRPSNSHLWRFSAFREILHYTLSDNSWEGS